ncbi:glycosyltransferase family 2 protein [Luteimonas sp. R10]|uniref:glycosyltransferase family 2 protein n=1 Tax=Luteimonas sp. R10 TaxID=3108176 RepID=UPI003085ACB8|nr:glycosyltransferase [Luteimonas sp. R10]
MSSKSDWKPASPSGEAGNETGRQSALDQGMVGHLRGQLHALQLALDAAIGEIEALRNSTSWRVTRPIRMLKRALTGEVAQRSAESYASGSSRTSLVPPEIRRFHDSPPEDRNDVYQLVDADMAMAPILALASARQLRSDAARIAFLGSDELDAELRFDAHVLRVGEADWRQALRHGEWDYLLVETVWHAGRSGWRSALLCDHRGTDSVRQLIEHCRRIGLPVVVWFREDEASYRWFAWLGELADQVYAIDEEVLAHLMRDHPAKCGLLSPCIQPVLHNPVRSSLLQSAGSRLPAQVLYDGWWDVAGGSVELSQLLSIAPHLRICESEWEFGGLRLRDHQASLDRTIGCVDPIAKGALDRLGALELFADGSLRAGWRRQQAMLRTAACGSVVVDCGQDGLGRQGVARSGGGQPQSQFVASILGDTLARMEIVHRIRRELLSGHCLVDRLETVARDLGLSRGRAPSCPSVAMILVTMRPQLLEACLQRFRAELYPNRELIVVLHGQHDLAAARSLVRSGEAVRIFSMPRLHSLGACLNAAISMTDAAYWTKMDDDDLYGPHYLYDIMLARRYVDFDVAGKPPMFAYLERTDELFWDPVWAEHAHLWHAPDESSSALVAGGTITGRREVFEQIQFSERRRGGSDSDFIRRCYESGVGVLALDGFNFVRYRSAHAGFHTWAMDEREVRDRAQAVGARADVVSIAYQ